MLRELQNSGLLSSKQAHVSLSYFSLFLNYGKTFSKCKSRVSLCLILACSEINRVSYDKELDCSPCFPLFRPLSSNLHLCCFGPCGWPDCVRLGVALPVPLLSSRGWISLVLLALNCLLPAAPCPPELLLAGGWLWPQRPCTRRGPGSIRVVGLLRAGMLLSGALQGLSSPEHAGLNVPLGWLV